MQLNVPATTPSFNIKKSNMDKNKIKHDSHRKPLGVELKGRSGGIHLVEEPADCLTASDHAFDLKTDLFSGRQTLSQGAGLHGIILIAALFLFSLHREMNDPAEAGFGFQ